MTKWHKYRDIKPNIKSIIKSKKNSHDVINERKVKTHSERLFLMLNNADESKLSSEEILNRYKDFSIVHKSLWIPIDLSYDNAITRDMTTINKSTIENKIKEMSVVVQNDEILWMYIAIDEKVLENDEIQCKAKVVDIILGDAKSTTPDKTLTIASDLDRRSNMWVKVDKIKKCGGVTTDRLQVLGSKTNLKEVILKSQIRFFIVEKPKK